MRLSFRDIGLTGGFIVLAALSAACGALAHRLAGQKTERRRWLVQALPLATASWPS